MVFVRPPTAARAARFQCFYSIAQGSLPGHDDDLTLCRRSSDRKCQRSTHLGPLLGWDEANIGERSKTDSRSTAQEVFPVGLARTGRQQMVRAIVNYDHCLLWELRRAIRGRWMPASHYSMMVDERRQHLLGSFPDVDCLRPVGSASAGSMNTKLA